MEIRSLWRPNGAQVCQVRSRSPIGDRLPKSCLPAFEVTYVRYAVATLRVGQVPVGMVAFRQGRKRILYLCASPPQTKPEQHSDNIDDQAVHLHAAYFQCLGTRRREVSSCKLPVSSLAAAFSVSAFLFPTAPLTLDFLSASTSAALSGEFPYSTSFSSTARLFPAISSSIQTRNSPPPSPSLSLPHDYSSSCVTSWIIHQ